MGGTCCWPIRSEPLPRLEPSLLWMSWCQPRTLVWDQRRLPSSRLCKSQPRLPRVLLRSPLSPMGLWCRRCTTLAQCSTPRSSISLTMKYAKINSAVNNNVKKGVLFATYSALIGESQGGGKYKSRLKQILHWCGDDFDGCIIFDECHKAKNLCPSGAGKP